MSIWIITTVTLGGVVGTEVHTDEGLAAARYRGLGDDMFGFRTVQMDRVEIPVELCRD